MTPDLLHKSARRLPNARNITKKRLVIVCGNSGIGFVTAEKEGAGTLHGYVHENWKNTMNIRVLAFFLLKHSQAKEQKRNQYTTEQTQSIHNRHSSWQELNWKSFRRLTSVSAQEEWELISMRILIHAIKFPPKLLPSSQ